MRIEQQHNYKNKNKKNWALNEKSRKLNVDEYVQYANKAKISEEEKKRKQTQST